jgi:DNA polymerase III delta prime subunit
VAVIVDVDQLTVQAANRLLKTLEEPPEDGLIIMTTSRRRHLLPTVLSRCVRWPVAPPAAQSTLKVLKAAYEAAGYTHGNLEYFEDLLRRAALSPKLALAFMEEDAQASTNPLKEALALVAAGHAASGKTDESLTALLKAAEALARPKEFSAARLLQSLEVELNHWYRQQLSNGVTAASTPYQRSVRRQILRDTKRLASRGRVALNKQLIAEAVALSQR